MEEVLTEIGAGDLPRLLVLNKIDIADDATVQQLIRAHGNAAAVSGRTGHGVDELIATVTTLLASSRRVVEALVPYAHSELVALAHRDGTVVTEEHRADGTYVVAQLDGGAAASLERFATTNGASPSDQASTD